MRYVVLLCNGCRNRVNGLLNSLEYTSTAIICRCTKALTSRSLHARREFCRLMWTLRLWNVRLGPHYKTFEKYSKRYEMFQIDLISHTIDKYLTSILWDERVYKDCIFFEILLVKEDKLLLPVTWRDLNFFILILNLKYQSLYVARKN